MTEWTIRALEGEPRLVWTYGASLVELLADERLRIRSAGGADLVNMRDPARYPTTRPELDMLRAALAYALQRVERELSLDGASLVFPVKPAQSDVTHE